MALKAAYPPRFHLTYALASPSAPILPQLPDSSIGTVKISPLNSSNHPQAEKPNVWRSKSIFVVVISELLV